MHNTRKSKTVQIWHKKAANRLHQAAQNVSANQDRQAKKQGAFQMVLDVKVYLPVQKVYMCYHFKLQVQP